eukprot:gene10370-11481_t
MVTAVDEEGNLLEWAEDFLEIMTSPAISAPLSSLHVADMGSSEDFLEVDISEDRRGSEAKSRKRSSRGSKVSQKRRRKQSFLMRADRDDHGRDVFVATKTSLYPTFERANFLIYLPAVISQFHNTGDLPTIRGIIGSRAQKDCLVRMAPMKDPVVGADYIALFFEALLTYQPDDVFFVTSTVCCEGVVTSTCVFKKSHCNQLIDFVNADASHRNRLHAMAGHFERCLYLDYLDQDKTEEERAAIAALVSSDRDLVVYGTGTFTITFDDLEKKISCFDLSVSFNKILPI